MGIFAAGWTVWIYRLPIPSTPQTAITAAARGAVLSTNGNYAAALASYSSALAADDNYSPAYSGRARARLLAANPDYATTRAVTDTSAGTFGKAELDARRALALNSRDILGTALVAVMSFYRGEYGAAIKAADEGLRINPKVPDLWLLKSAAEAAAGDGRCGDQLTEPGACRAARLSALRSARVSSPRATSATSPGWSGTLPPGPALHGGSPTGSSRSRPPSPSGARFRHSLQNAVPSPCADFDTRRAD